MARRCAPTSARLEQQQQQHAMRGLTASLAALHRRAAAAACIHPAASRMQQFTTAARSSSRLSAAAQAPAAALDTTQTTPASPPPRAAYVHVPFCKRKCFYCDFPVEAVGLANADKPKTQDRMAAYVDLVCAEIQATSPLPGQQPLQTVSFGGGTPSLVPPEQLSRILGVLQAQYGIAPAAELSLEADPGTFDAARLQEYRTMGITRVSVGVQCFQQELLESCGRSHSLQDVHAALSAVRAAGFPSWSLDLISGLPRLTEQLWLSSLQQAVAAGPDHISVYDLQVEAGTPFARWYSGPESPLPHEPEAARMFELATATLTAAGYEHYEISNYAKPGHRSRHNQVYWSSSQPYYAFGLGAASYTRGRRFTRPRGMREYEAWVGQHVAAGSGDPAAQLPLETQEDRLLDLIMLQLRLSDGLDLQQLQRQFGARVCAALLPSIQQAMQHGTMALAAAGSVQGATLGAEEAALAQGAALQQQLDAGQPCRVRLTDPAGFLLSNDVISGLFAALDPSMLQEATGECV